MNIWKSIYWWSNLFAYFFGKQNLADWTCLVMPLFSYLLKLLAEVVLMGQLLQNSFCDIIYIYNVGNWCFLFFSKIICLFIWVWVFHRFITFYCNLPMQSFLLDLRRVCSDSSSDSYTVGDLVRLLDLNKSRNFMVSIEIIIHRLTAVIYLNF